MRVGGDFWEPAIVVSRSVDLVGCTNSEKMGNKEFKDGSFSFSEGINLCKCPMVDVARVVFLLYHINSIPKTLNMTPVSINTA